MTSDEQPDPKLDLIHIVNLFSISAFDLESRHALKVIVTRSSAAADCLPVCVQHRPLHIDSAQHNNVGGNQRR
jgi:hypothetical protein